MQGQGQGLTALTILMCIEQTGPSFHAAMLLWMDETLIGRNCITTKLENGVEVRRVIYTSQSPQNCVGIRMLGQWRCCHD